MYYIIWRDWNEVHVEEIEHIKTARDICAELRRKEEKDDYGTHIIAVIEGTRWYTKVKRIKVVDEVEFVLTKPKLKDLGDYDGHNVT